jgi:hypothetical protein
MSDNTQYEHQTVPLNTLSYLTFLETLLVICIVLGMIFNVGLKGA